VRPEDIDELDGGLADDNDGESDYGQIDEMISSKIMEHLQGDWAVV
jgi:hypothetical protein